MSYFTKDFIKFFKSLEKNNNTTWFHAHKSEYEKFVKVPFISLVDDVIVHIRQIDPEINISPKEAIFRINRDIRFSKDKSPYKTNTSAVVSKGGKKGKHNPGIFFMLGGSGIGIGGGVHAIDSNTLYKIRTYVSKNSTQLEKLVNEKEFKKVYKATKRERIRYGKDLAKLKVYPKKITEDYIRRINKLFL